MDVIQQMYQAYIDGDMETFGRLGATKVNAMATVMRIIEVTGVKQGAGDGSSSAAEGTPSEHGVDKGTRKETPGKDGTK